MTDAVVSLFDPRRERWEDHFIRQEALILSLTPTSRATVELLNMNEPERLEMRETLLENGEC